MSEIAGVDGPGLELRRRKRAHVSVGFPMVVLLVAMTLSLSAQVVATGSRLLAPIADPARRSGGRRSES